MQRKARTRTTTSHLRGQRSQFSHQELEVEGNGEDGGGGGVEANPAAVYPGRRGDEVEAEDDLFPKTATLSAMETRINCNSAFHGFKRADTKISACQVCKRRLLQFVAAVHCHDVHKGYTGEEMNE